jgi:hypothetical protein
MAPAGAPTALRFIKAEASLTSYLWSLETAANNSAGFPILDYCSLSNRW